MATTIPTDEDASDDAGGRRSTETRQRILDAAAQQFANRGFDGTKFREVGEIAGVSFQSIRYHFGSKEQLWEAVVDQLYVTGRSAALNHEQALAGLPPRQQLQAQVRALIAYNARNTELQRILLREAMKRSERYERAFNRCIKDMERNLTAFLEKLQSEGVIKSDLNLADLFYAFHGAVIYRLVAPPAEDLGEDGETMTDAVIDRHAETITRLLMAD